MNILIVKKLVDILRLVIVVIVNVALEVGICGKLAGNVRALCRCGIRIPPARNRCPAFVKDKCLEPMFGDVGQAETKAAMLLMPIATTSSRTCTKPIVSRSFYFVCISIHFNISVKAVGENV